MSKTVPAVPFYLDDGSETSVYMRTCSSSVYSTSSSEHGVLMPSLTNSPFADVRGQCVPLYSHQPSPTMQWMPRASAADYSPAWLSSSHFPQVLRCFFSFLLEQLSADGHTSSQLTSSVCDNA